MTLENKWLRSWRRAFQNRSRADLTRSFTMVHAGRCGGSHRFLRRVVLSLGMESASEKSRSKRGNWEGRLVSMHDTSEIEVLQGEPADLVQLCFELSELAFAMSRQAMPTYLRCEMPGRLVVSRTLQ